MSEKITTVGEEVQQNLFTVHKHDSRNISDVIKDKIIDVTITSPPYFDLKDYGYEEQIGYGQSYEQYLEDLQQVFKEVYDVTKETGTLWVIIDSFRKDGKVTPLPFDFSNKIQQVGWKLQEVIIWAKDRTVPWAHKGQMRNLFEYILVFSKSADYNFYIDKVRDQANLKKWWIKYPERYNPKGKAPTGIWHYDIPTQGSWGDGYIKHFCPLPEELISQIIDLTTSEKDIVLDPFSGSGAVLAKADNMNRKYIGFELNSNYIQMFKDYLIKTGEYKRNVYEKLKNNSINQDDFYQLILRLRILKYARVLYNKIKSYSDIISKIYVEKSEETSSKKHALTVSNYHFLLKDRSEISVLEEAIQKESSKTPLSKFGIEAKFYYYSDVNDFENLVNNKTVYTYTSSSTHAFSRKLEKFQLWNLKQKEIIFSPESVFLNEKDYDN